MDKYNYVIWGSDWDLYLFSYSDLFGLSNVEYIANTNNIGCFSKFYTLNRILNNKYGFPVLGLWYNALSRRNFFNGNNLCFIYTWNWIRDNDKTGFVNYFKKKYYGSKHVLFLQDIVKSHEKDSYSIENAKKDFDMILSFDPHDCKMYNLVYYPLVFSEYKKSSNINVTNDIYFLGQIKNRKRELLDLFYLLKEKELKVDFILIGDREKDGDGFPDDVCFINSMPYLENLRHVEKTRCLLEVMQHGGTGYTQRCSEAVCLGKKILTNNQMIKEAPFFREDYVSIFSSIDSIDKNFLNTIHSSDYVDYGESHRKMLSPINLLSYLQINL